jgi:hypothetical protein
MPLFPSTGRKWFPANVGNYHLFSAASSQGEKQDENQHKIYSTFSAFGWFPLIFEWA